MISVGFVFMFLTIFILGFAYVLSDKENRELKEENKALKEKDKDLEKENSFLMMEIFHNVSGGYQKYKEKKEKEESDKE